MVNSYFQSIKNKKPTHGSFLTRSRDTLAKIAEMTRPVSNPTGPRNSRNFVFSTVEKEGEESSDEPKKPQVSWWEQNYN